MGMLFFSLFVCLCLLQEILFIYLFILMLIILFLVGGKEKCCLEFVSGEVIKGTGY